MRGDPAGAAYRSAINFPISTLAAPSVVSTTPNLQAVSGSVSIDPALNPQLVVDTMSLGGTTITSTGAQLNYSSGQLFTEIDICRGSTSGSILVSGPSYVRWRYLTSKTIFVTYNVQLDGLNSNNATGFFQLKLPGSFTNEIGNALAAGYNLNMLGGYNVGYVAALNANYILAFYFGDGYPVTVPNAMALVAIISGVLFIN